MYAYVAGTKLVQRGQSWNWLDVCLTRVFNAAGCTLCFTYYRRLFYFKND